ncbi:signal recognition particle receptor subunit alpha [Nematocida sp. LUAm3]|nr:signal recognition particle receptor subunit alpha [Nematocida sp. LUAm3]KAI5175921.1 signal recognition particle receptor subunit alpha [Nematocida sp. LUAm2]KAI5178697.1 signal recognition particle receptor subunit alpha [Nematocida sp. LUAm1]
MEQERIAYGVLFSKGGIVREEFGESPSYLYELIKNITLTGKIQSIRVRNDLVSYTCGTYNVYLLVYKNKEQEKRVEELLEEAKKKTEASKDGLVAGGIFRRKEEEVDEVVDVDEDAKPNGVSLEEDSDDEEESNIWNKWKKSKGLFGFLSGKKEVSEKQLVEHFISRNVPASLSSTIAKEITSLKNADVSHDSEKDKIKKSSRKVLSQMVPRLTAEEILKEIENKRKTGEGPFVFCMVGVNGVGKSTTLSKLSLWLLKNNLSISVAACDGFRSGAIEQLRKYVDRYKNRGHTISLFERGYGKDESSIASQAIKDAKEKKYDIVIIDTCGRMPGNHSSMTSLSKMIRVNKPSMILYVGEALVGTDSIDQIKIFNKYVEAADVDKKIDGIVVTKCDTVDEKIGSILTFAHTIDKPIVFIGVGQKNVDLLPFNINVLCEAFDL